MKFMSQTILFTIVIILIVCSIICQIMIGIYYQNMIRATDSMVSTENKLLKQCKQKFIQCYRTNGGVANIPVFVERFLNKVRIWHLTFRGLWHLSGQLILLSVIVSGVGICQGIITGERFQKLMPYYIICFVGLYFFFGLASLIDMQGSRQIVKINLIDFLENHVAVRLQNGMDEKEKMDTQENNENEQIVEKKGNKEIPQKAFSQEDAKELEELLKAFLT